MLDSVGGRLRAGWSLEGEVLGTTIATEGAYHLSTIHLEAQFEK